MRIVKNAIFCATCKQEIESKHEHDMVICPGGHVAVDGGHEYLKRSFFAEDGKYFGYEERSVTIPPPQTTNIANEIEIERERARLEFNKPGVKK